MKPALLIVFGLIVASFANATEFKCVDTKHEYPGAGVRLAISNSEIQAEASGDLGDLFGGKTMKFDGTYKPRQEHQGALRYIGGNDCGSFALILDQNMATGHSGYATFQQDCDSDGTGPSYTTFICTQ